VLDGGEIVERGTHDELLAVRGRYRMLNFSDDVALAWPGEPP